MGLVIIMYGMAECPPSPTQAPVPHCYIMLGIHVCNSYFFTLCVDLCSNIRSYRSIGDEAFMRAFESTTLAFEEWSHEVSINLSTMIYTLYQLEM